MGVVWLSLKLNSVALGGGLGVLVWEVGRGAGAVLKLWDVIAMLVLWKLHVINDLRCLLLGWWGGLRGG